MNDGPEHKFNYDPRGLEGFRDGEQFLGLYKIEGRDVVWILYLADEPTAGFRFLTCHASPHPHYVPDPVAWARMPTP